jgi:ribosomal protein L34E
MFYVDPETSVDLICFIVYRNQEKSRLSKRQKTVYRAYGGVLSHTAVR